MNEEEESTDDKRPVDRNLVTHHMFKVGSIISRLVDLIWEFDFVRAAKGHHYSGVPTPHNLSMIIDQLLEDDTLSFEQGDVNRLKKMQEYINETLDTIFKEGIAKAELLWSVASHEEKDNFATYPAETFHELARTFATFEHISEMSWYLEGFSRQWREEWSKYIIKRAE